MRAIPSTNSSPRAFWVAVAICAATLAYFVARFNFLTDDAFILFRYSRNFAEGFGLVYNPGTNPPVEGYSEFLWAVLLGAVEWLKLDVTFWSRALTISGSFVLLLALLDFGRRKLGLGSIGLIAAGLLFSTNPTVGVWSTSGLSSSLFALAIFGFYVALFFDAEKPRGLLAGVAGVATSLLRADGPYWVVCILAIAILGYLWRRSLEQNGPWLKAAFGPSPFRKAMLQAGCILALSGGIFVAWRMHVYGDYLPNTARAKVGMTKLSLERGLNYLVTYWLMLPALTLVFLAGLGSLVIGLRRRSATAFGPLDAATLVAAATFAYAILVGGDFMAMGRFFIPAAPFLALLFGAQIERFLQRGEGVALGALAVALLANVLPAFNQHLVPKSLREQFHFRWSNELYSTEYNYWRGMGNRCREWMAEGKALGLYAKPGESLVLAPIGAVGYYSRLVIYDSMGLTNKDVLSASKPGTVRSSPGHDRHVPMQFFDRYQPTYRKAMILDPWTSKDELPRVQQDPKTRLIDLKEEDGFKPNSVFLLRRW